jgi:hypothetical protein
MDSTEPVEVLTLYYQLSLRQSSSTFPKLSNQSDTYRTKDPEIYHNNKGDIAD